MSENSEITSKRLKCGIKCYLSNDKLALDVNLFTDVI